LTNAPSNEKEDESLQNVVFIFFFIHYILCLYMRLFSLINSPIFFQNRFLFCAVEYGFVNDFLIKLYFKATVIYLVFTHSLFHKKGAYLVSLKRPLMEHFDCHLTSNSSFLVLFSIVAPEIQNRFRTPKEIFQLIFCNASRFFPRYGIVLVF
jgi:hypothetical protein